MTPEQAEARKPIDPRVVIPAAVLRGGSKADELQAQFIASLNGEQQEGEQQEGEQQEEGGQEPQPTPPSEPAPEPPPQQPQPAPRPRPPAAQQEGDETWEQKFRSAQGRLRERDNTIQDLRTRLGNLEATIASMATPAPAPVAPEPPARFLTDDDIETYGDDFLGAVKRQAQEVIEPLRRQYEDRIAQIDGRVTSVQQVIGKTAKERMIDHMNSTHQGWLQQNEDPAFIEWLDQEDILTGQRRQDMLDVAWSRNDATRVAAFFDTFLREQGITAEPTGARQTNGRKAPVVSLGQFAAPGRAKAGEPPAKPQAKQPISRQFIKQFYNDVSAGRYANRAAEQAQIEADIFAANAEGRIT